MDSHRLRSVLQQIADANLPSQPSGSVLSQYKWAVLHIERLRSTAAAALCGDIFEQTYAPAPERAPLGLRGAWADPRLAYIYLLADRLAETLPEDTAEESCVRLAMSKIDEADMILRAKLKDKERCGE